MNCPNHPDGNRHPVTGDHWPSCFECEQEAIDRYGRGDPYGDYSERPAKQKPLKSYPWQR